MIIDMAEENILLPESMSERLRLLDADRVMVLVGGGDLSDPLLAREVAEHACDRAAGRCGRGGRGDGGVSCLQAADLRRNKKPPA